MFTIHLKNTTNSTYAYIPTQHVIYVTQICALSSQCETKPTKLYCSTSMDIPYKYIVRYHFTHNTALYQGKDFSSSSKV